MLVSAGEGEVQTLLDKLAMEVERNTRLSVELQEGHTGNEVKMSIIMYIHDNIIYVGMGGIGAGESGSLGGRVV